MFSELVVQIPNSMANSQTRNQNIGRLATVKRYLGIEQCFVAIILASKVNNATTDLVFNLSLISHKCLKVRAGNKTSAVATSYLPLGLYFNWE